MDAGRRRSGCLGATARSPTRAPPATWSTRWRKASPGTSPTCGVSCPAPSVVVQLDEPALPAVLAGRLQTISGFGRLPAVGGDHRRTGAEDRAGGGRVGRCRRHLGPLLCARRAASSCCVAPAPVRSPLDLSLLDARAWESVAVAVEAGVALWAGCRAHLGDALPPVRELVDAVRRPWRRRRSRRSRTSPQWSSRPTCGLAGSSPTDAALGADALRRDRPRAAEVAAG